MSHREHQYELLSAYLDGELTPPQARALEEAMADEPALRAEFERLKRVRDAVRTLPHQAAPAALAERVLGQIERGCVLESPAAPTGGKSPWTYYLSAAAAAVVLLGLGLGAYLLLHQPSYLDKQESYGVKKNADAPPSEPQPELALRPQERQEPRPMAKEEKDSASPGLAGPTVPTPAKGRSEQFASAAESRPTELAKAEVSARGESTAMRDELRPSEDRANPRPQAGDLLVDNRSARGPAGPEESAGKLTAQGPPMFEPNEAPPSAPMALAPAAAAPAAMPTAAGPGRVAGISRGAPLAASAPATRPALAAADAKPVMYFDLAVPDLRLVIRVGDLAAAGRHMREVLEVAQRAHVAAEAADLGGAMCVSFNGRIVRQDGAVQYEFRIHPRAMPLLVRALTEMESLEQSWQVLQSPRPLESKWQVLRECLGEAMAASQPVRDRVVISRQELPTTRGAGFDIEMFSSYSLVDTAATATSPAAPPPGGTPAATKPGQQWVEPYNLIVRIEGPSGDTAATSTATAASHPAP